MKSFPWKSAIFAIALFGTPYTSHAAPQILAALPVESGVELTCADGVCVAELSTYCLQRERPAPSMGTAYVPATDEQFTLVLANDDGNEIRLPASKHMLFVEHRGFMAVAATIEMGRLKSLGATHAKLVVWEGASLIPVPEAGDPNPLTEDEIAFVTDSLREHGQRIVDQTPQAGTAQLLAKLNAALPNSGPISSPSFDTMWQQSIGDELPLSFDGSAVNGARQAYEDCIGSNSAYSVGGLKRCLEYQHDDLIRDLNVDYWQSQPGS